jgi:hypothetical protein
MHSDIDMSNLAECKRQFERAVNLVRIGKQSYLSAFSDLPEMLSTSVTLRKNIEESLATAYCLEQEAIRNRNKAREDAIKLTYIQEDINNILLSHIPKAENVLPPDRTHRDV